MPPITSSQKLMVGQFMTLTGVPDKTAAKVSTAECQTPPLRYILSDYRVPYSFSRRRGGSSI